MRNLITHGLYAETRPHLPASDALYFPLYFQLKDTHQFSPARLTLFPLKSTIQFRLKESIAILRNSLSGGSSARPGMYFEAEIKEGV